MVFVWGLRLMMCLNGPFYGYVVSFVPTQAVFLYLLVLLLMFRTIE